jgi:hypothetical protein
MSMRTALDTVTTIHAALAAAGMPRTSRMNGGEIVGWTTSLGSTGFSVRENGDGLLHWHVVVSGKPLLSYREYRDGDDDLHEPIDPERLDAPIRAVFEAQGLEVRSVGCSGHQTMWDDDVDYTVVTTRPAWLEAKPDAVRHRPRW